MKKKAKVWITAIVLISMFAFTPFHAGAQESKSPKESFGIIFFTGSLISDAWDFFIKSSFLPRAAVDYIAGLAFGPSPKEYWQKTYDDAPFLRDYFVSDSRFSIATVENINPASTLSTQAANKNVEPVIQTTPTRPPVEVTQVTRSSGNASPNTLSVSHPQTALPSETEKMVLSHITSQLPRCELRSVNLGTAETTVKLEGPQVMTPRFASTFKLVGETRLPLLALLHCSSDGITIYDKPIVLREEHTFTAMFDSGGVHELIHEYTNKLGENKVFRQPIEVIGFVRNLN